jgi:Helix-turn-helix.
MQNKAKLRLIEARKKKEYSQEYVSNTLGMDISSYSRRESGHIKISNREWKKLSEILETPLEDIFEPEDSMVLIFNDNSSGNGNGNGNIVTNYALQQSVLDLQKKYIEKLENEIQSLKEQIQLLNK